MSKPAILFIPGSFAVPELYDTVVNAIAAKGYDIEALHLPSIGFIPAPTSGEDQKQTREGEPVTMYDDAAFIAQRTTSLAEEGRDVILVAHSYGSVPMTESTHGLGKEERLKQGLTGGVVRLAYINALIPAVGMPAGSVLAGIPEEQKVVMELDEHGWLRIEPNAQAARICFTDMPLEEGKIWAEKFAPHSAASFMGELRHAGYKGLPVSYLLCEDDLTVPAQIQREGIEMMERESGTPVDVTSIKAGHCPNASVPEKVVDWILDLVKKV